MTFTYTHAHIPRLVCSSSKGQMQYYVLSKYRPIKVKPKTIRQIIEESTPSFSTKKKKKGLALNKFHDFFEVK